MCQPNGSWHFESSCGPSPSDGGADGPVDSDGGKCTVTSTSSLPGVSIVFHDPVVCEFTIAQAQAGISIPYDVVIASDVTGVVPEPQDGGKCGQPASSGLILFERLGGGGQSYCLCDTGLCLPTTPPPTTLHAGTYASAFSWDGKNWGGPSDTGNPQVAPFPPGDYTLTVSATGTRGGASFAVSGTLDIHLTP
jgi:hypothetical protein